jgi:hypothetical protein
MDGRGVPGVAYDPAAYTAAWSLANRVSLLHHGSRLESIASANRAHLQVQRRMSRVAAVVQQLFRRFVFAPDRGELLSARVGFAEVCAEAALAVMELLHGSPR